MKETLDSMHIHPSSGRGEKKLGQTKESAGEFAQRRSRLLVRTVNRRRVASAY